jgi:hypothetical protein
MAKSRKQRRNMRKVKRGGGQGAGYEPGGALNPGLGNGLMTNRSYDACMSSARPGQMSFSASGGLPGMRGGRYTNNLTQNHAGFAQIDKVGCTPNHINPLNQRGGVGLRGASDMGVYEAHTARYTTQPSQFVGSTGAPILLNRPLDGVAWSKSCSQTAGRRYKKSSKKSKTRRSRKHGGAIGENAVTALKSMGTDPEQMLIKMINTPGYKSGMTQQVGEYTFKATGSSRYFDLHVKKSDANDSTYVVTKSLRD